MIDAYINGKQDNIIWATGAVSLEDRKKRLQAAFQGAKISLPTLDQQQDS